MENLNNYKILYTKNEPVFDQLAALTATILSTPVAMINFVDKNKVWTKADQYGDTGVAAGREISLCSMAIQNDSITVYEDILDADYPCLISNPLIAGEVGLRFYAAAAITTNEGFNVGVVCVVDQKPRAFTDDDKKKLEMVAGMVRNEMNKRIGISTSIIS